MIETTLLVLIIMVIICAVMIFFVVKSIKKENTKDTTDEEEDYRAEMLADLEASGKSFGKTGAYGLNADDINFLYDNGWALICYDPSSYKAVFKRRVTE